MFLEILESVFLVAALVIIVLQVRATSLSQYRALNIAFWLLMAASFLINGLESQTGWQWVWYVAAVAAAAAAFAPIKPRRFVVAEIEE